jgi:hypothetical protein
MKWENYPNLRKKPPAPAKNRGRVQRAIKRAFIASGAEVLASSEIYSWTHPRLRLGRRKTMPFGIYWGTLQVLRRICDPVDRSDSVSGAPITALFEAGGVRAESSFKRPAGGRGESVGAFKPAGGGLGRASASRPSGQWNDDDFDVLANGEVVGRIYKANAAPVGSPWMWTLAFGHHEGRSPTPIHSRNIC